MADQNMIQNVASVLEQVIGSGLVVNGQVGINGLTVTSVDKAKELGIVPQKSKQSDQSNQNGQSNQQQNGQSNQQQNEQKEASGKQGKQQPNEQQQQQLSREDYDGLREEIGYLRKLLESTQQDQPESKNKTSQPK